MITLKLDIQTSETERILKYQREYSSLLHVYYNRYSEGMSQKDCKHLQLNNVELLDSWFRQSCIYEAIALSKKEKVIFGGKTLFKKRSKNKISKEEFKQQRCSPIYSIGENSNPTVKGNRKFFIQDLKTIIFKPSRKEKIELTINVKSKTWKKYLELLMIHQDQRDLSITYKLSSKCIWISFDEAILKEKSYAKIKDRILAIDLNPNYIGWSVVDWKDSECYNVIDKGVLTIKSLNDKEESLKVASNDKRKIHLSNKRRFEVFECCKFLKEKMKHFKCSLFSIEALNIKSRR